MSKTKRRAIDMLKNKDISALSGLNRFKVSEAIRYEDRSLLQKIADSLSPVFPGITVDRLIAPLPL